VRHAATDVLIQGNKIYGHHRWISGSSVAYSRADASYRRDDANAINLEGTATGQVRRVQIRANDLHDNGGDGIQCLGAHDATGRDDSHDPGDLDAVDNRYHANEEDGADIKSCQRVSVRGSVSPDNAGSAANNKIYHLRPTDKNADLPGNHSGGGAIVVHYYARQVLIENTRIWDTCGGIGIGRADYPPVQNVIIRRNLFFNLVGAAASVGDNKCAGRGIRITSAAHVDMHDNTFDNVPAEAVMLATDNGNDGSVSDDIDVWNNIINNAGTWISLRRHSTSVPGGATNVEADRNLFWHPDATANHFILEVTRVDLTAWRAGTGQDQSSLRADPLFVDDPANNDYYVKTEPRSPALDSALNNTGAPFCGAGPDIGFRERCP